MIELANIPRYDDRNFTELISPKRPTGALPRKTIYGSTDAQACGLVPMADYLGDLIDPKDFKEVIERCHAKKVFPMYWEDHAGVEGWNQNGLPYCWAWGATGALMAKRANMGLPNELLAPNTLGWLVNWRNTGHYMDATIKGLRERGVAPQSYVPDIHSRDPRTFKAGWEDAALNYRAGEWSDIDVSRGDLFTIRQCLTILRGGDPIYGGLWWWGHALQLVGYEWDESEPHNVLSIWWNSHKDDLIEISGSRGVPDEGYGITSGSLPG